MRSGWAEQLRTLARTLSENGKREVSTQMLCAAVGADDTPTKARVRWAVTNMVKRGEMARVRDGFFQYVPGTAAAVERHGKSYKHMWRIIRTENAVWTVANVAGTTRAHIVTVSDYCKWLKRENFITQCGKQGNTRLYRTTQKAVDHVETPYPPVASKDAYAKERNAASRLIHIFTKMNPGEFCEQIITECRAILARFEKGETHVE